MEALQEYENDDYIAEFSRNISLINDADNDNIDSSGDINEIEEIQENIRGRGREWKDWSSEVENAIDDDIISIGERDDKHNENNNSNFNINLNFNKNINLTSNKRRICSGLYSAKISVYINCTSANFGSSCHVETIAKEIWKNRFKKRFSRKKLNLKEKKILNRQIYAENLQQQDNNSKEIKTYM
uniref:Uncharacterized protein n=1 Tax=Rhizophagus irregularis (strain DAOM 181602 / DAOM 197198 / MUCL 43194) TaxID=747089 RepID=U9U5E3_RHIID